MNLSRCSKLAAALVVLLLAAAVPAAAVSVSGDVPATAEVGEKQTTTFTVTEPFDEYEQWTLQAETQLEDVTWQVTTFGIADNQVDEQTVTGQSMSYDLQASSGVVRVEVKLVGTTPSVSEWSYEPPQQFTYAEFVQSQEGGASDTLQSYETRPYTTESDEARTAIDDAQSAIESAKSAGGASATPNATWRTPSSSSTPATSSRRRTTPRRPSRPRTTRHPPPSRRTCSCWWLPASSSSC